MLGSPIFDFEKKFARYNESKYAISCNSGTDALYIILKALGVDNKSEVITTSLSGYLLQAQLVIQVRNLFL